MKTINVAIGLDLGGSSLKYAIVNKNGEILREGQKPVQASFDNSKMQEIFMEVVGQLKQFAAQHSLKILGIGFGTPGSVEIETGFLAGYSPNLPNWGETNIKELFQSTQIPCFPDNDANLAAWGEYYWSQGKKPRNMIYLTIGTGIGGGIVLNGSLYRGSFDRGAEIGHMSIHKDGRPCNCGGTGCFEQYASTTALLREYRDISGLQLDNAKLFFQRVRQNESQALQALSVFYNSLSTGLASLINIFNPHEIVIGGGISAAENFSIEIIREKTAEKTMKNSFENVQIRKANLHNQAGVLGGAAMVFQEVLYE